MKKFFVSSFLALSLLTNLSFAQTVKPRPRPTNTRTTAAAIPRQDTEVPIVTKTLPNGLEIIVLPDSGVPLVTVELDVRNGSFTEPPELNGLSHLYEHMFFKSSQAMQLRRCERQLADSGCDNLRNLKSQIGDVSYLDNLADMGIVYNGSTREEVVNYFYTTTSPYLMTAIRGMNDAVRYPLFDESEFDDEKRVVLGEVDRNEANPNAELNRLMNEMLFYKYPTRKTPLGTRETITTATTEKMRLIQSRYYVPNNAALVVTGDVKPDEVFKLAEKIMGDWARRPVDPFKEFPLVEHPPLPKSEAAIVEKNLGEDAQGAQNVLIEIGWHGPSVGKDTNATYAADVFSYILTQPDSRFQRDLVDAGLVSAAGIGYYTQRNIGPINVIFSTTPEKAKAALKAVYAEIEQFGSPNYFTNEELENSKTILASSDLFDREKLSEYVHILGFWWSSTGIDYFRGYQKNLNTVSRKDINRYINTYITGKPHVGVALISPGSQVVVRLTPNDLIGDLGDRKK